MNIKIGADVKRAVSGLKRVGRQSKKTGVSMKSLAVGAAAATAAYAALNLASRAATVSFKQSGTELAKLGDRMAKQARMVGVTAEQYQVFEFAAERSGTSITAVSNGLKKLGRVMLDARNGSRQIADTFEAMGVELLTDEGVLRDVNDVFLELSDTFSAMGPSAERTGSMMLLLGRSGTNLANMMSSGARGVTDMKKVLEDLDAIMSDELLASSELLVDAQADMKFATRGLWIEIGTHLIPALTGSMQEITKFIVALDGEAIGRFFVKVVNLADTFLYLTESILGTRTAVGEFSDTLVGDLRQVETQISSTEDRLSEITRVTQDMYAGVGGGFAIKSQLKPLGLYSDSIKTAADAIVVLNEAYGRTEANLETQRKAYSALREEYQKQLKNNKEEVKDGDLIKKLLSSILAKRNAGTAARKAANAETKRTIALMKEESKLFKERFDYITKVYDDYQNTFEKDDLGRLNRLFENRLIGEREYQDRSLAEIKRAAQEEHDARVLKSEDFLEISGKTAENMMRHHQEVADSRLHMDRDVQLASDEIHRGVLEQNMAVVASYSEAAAAVGDVFSALSSIAMQAYEGGDENAKKHAMALFQISQAFALATATVNTALAVTQASISAPPPANIIPMIAAGATGAAEIATIIGTSIKGIGDAGLTGDTLKKAGLNNHSAIVMRNDETLLDPVGTKHITEMLAMQKAQMQGGGGEQSIRTTVELDGRVLGESVDNYLIRQQERGLAYGNRVRQEYV
jgi:hypothetical protein